jgi:hypothetical protein
VGLCDRQAVNDALGARRSGASPRDHHARDAAGRNRVRRGLLGHQPAGQEAASSSRKERRPREGADDGADFVACGQHKADCVFNLAALQQLTPSSASRARREHRHPKASSKTGRASPLDPLENKADCVFNLATLHQLTPSSASRARREHRHPKASSKTGRASPLDPLENTIGRKPKFKLGHFRTAPYYSSGHAARPTTLGRPPLARRMGRHRASSAGLARGALSDRRQGHGLMSERSRSATRLAGVLAFREGEGMRGTAGTLAHRPSWHCNYRELIRMLDVTIKSDGLAFCCGVDLRNALAQS